MILQLMQKIPDEETLITSLMDNDTSLQKRLPPLSNHLHQGQCVTETLIHFRIAIFLSETWSLMAIDEFCLSVEVAWQSRS
jgi:hypothetical protein